MIGTQVSNRTHQTNNHQQTSNNRSDTITIYTTPAPYSRIHITHQMLNMKGSTSIHGNRMLPLYFRYHEL
jgi:hypothetical protein